MEGLDIQQQTMETLNEVLKSVVIRSLRFSGEAVDDMGSQLNLSTSKRIVRKEIGTPVG